MEKRQNEDSDLLEKPLDATEADAVDESGRESENVQDAEAGGEPAAGEGGQPADDTDPDAADPADPTDPPADPDPESPDNPGGSGDGGDGTDPGSGSGDASGEGENPDPGERFLNSGAAASIEAPAEEKRERLAVSLLRMALTLLTGELPEEKFIPLMDATLAHEAVQAARAEGEIAGRNAVIEERLVTPPAGAPDLGGTPIARSRRAAASIFDLADLAR